MTVPSEDLPSLAARQAFSSVPAPAQAHSVVLGEGLLSGLHRLGVNPVHAVHAVCSVGAGVTGLIS